MCSIMIFMKLNLCRYDELQARWLVRNKLRPSFSGYSLEAPNSLLLGDNQWVVRNDSPACPNQEGEYRATFTLR